MAEPGRKVDAEAPGPAAGAAGPADDLLDQLRRERADFVN